MSLPEPYYEADGVTLYLGDCREIVPLLSPVDLMLTDPPYGIGADKAASDAALLRIRTQGASKAGRGWKYHGTSDWDSSRPDRETFELLSTASKHSIVWGGNYFADFLPPSSAWLVWDKGQRGFSLADFEMAWTSLSGAARMVCVPRGRAVLDGKQHPTQKSLSVIKWCITFADSRWKPIETILDPFCGSGTTLVAAKQLGRRAIGIEIEERYCEIAVKRLAQGCLDLA